MSIDQSDNITLSVYVEDSIAYLRKSSRGQKMLFKQYKSATEALRAFDNEVLEDYSRHGIYYDDFYGSQ